MTDKPKTPEETLLLANDRGEIGYAYGGDNLDLPSIRTLESRGWIEWSYDLTPNPLERFPKRNSIFVLTRSGQEKLRELRKSQK